MRPPDVSCPLRLTSACGPASEIPATRLAAPSRSDSPIATVPAASSLPANRSSRLHERVRIVFQVPWRSSEENRSPAITPAMIGNPHWPANPRITSEIAKPEECTQAPNSASVGVPLWTFSSVANANGPSAAITASTRVAIWARSF